MLVSPELLKSDFGRRMIMIDEPIEFSLYGCWIFQYIKLNFGTQETWGIECIKETANYYLQAKELQETLSVMKRLCKIAKSFV